MVTDFEKNKIHDFIKKNFEEYKVFLRTKNTPDFDIILFEPSLEIAEERGYGVTAMHRYDYLHDKHTITVWKDLYKEVLHAEYILFHEFTHLYDIAEYARGDKSKAAMIKGYTEYHAGQLEFLKLLKAKSVDNVEKFSLEQSIEILSGKKTVIEYICLAHKTVKDMIEKPNFPNDIEALAHTLGMAFNHLGRLSICMMFSTDYGRYADLLEDISSEENAFGQEFVIMGKMLIGFPSNTIINLSIAQYFKIVSNLLNKYEF